MKNNIVRFFSFLILIFVGLGGPFWLFILGAIGYIFFYTGIEIIILGAAIDAYFGFGSGGLFLYTFGTTIGLITVQWAKPHLSVYNQ